MSAYYVSLPSNRKKAVSLTKAQVDDILSQVYRVLEASRDENAQPELDLSLAELDEVAVACGLMEPLE